MLDALSRALERWASFRHAKLVTIAVGLLLVAPSITSGLAADDWFHRLVLTGSDALGGIHHRAIDLFVFMNGDPVVGHAQQEAGLIGWWADPGAALAFFRPLSAITHWLDYQLWPNAPWLMHVHSLLWFTLGLFMLARVYERFVEPRSAALLALLLFAIDDGHGFVVAWIANRNALITFALGLPVLLLHDRARRAESRAGVWLAAALFAVALLGGESAVAVGGYLVSYALFLDRGAIRQRVWSLVPVALVLVLWRLAYAGLGYGTHGSGLALDPVREPIAFVKGLAIRLPVLLLAQLATPPSDLWELFPAIHPWIQPAVLAGGLLFIGAFAWVSASVFRRDPAMRFWALGTVLAALPACAQVPSDRLLLYVAVGTQALVARLLVALVSRETWTDRSALLKRGMAALAAILALFHLVLAPMWLPLRSRGPADVASMLSPADRTLPADGRTVIVMNPPADAFTGYIMMRRAGQGRPLPPHLRWLATAASAMVVERLDARTLRVRLKDGFMSLASERMQRSPKNPMLVGYETRLSGLTIRVTAVTEDRRPEEIVAIFDVPLEDPSLAFLKWTTEGYAPFAVPPVGQSTSLPALDYTTLRM